VGQEDRLYVASRHTHSTKITTLTWGEDVLGSFSGEVGGDGRFMWPFCLIADSNEDLYLADAWLHRIIRFSREGEGLGKWGVPGDGEGQLNGPSGIAFDPDENVYVADSLNHRVQKFTKDGRFLLAFGEHGDRDGQLNMPWGIAVDELGDVYVADWRNDRVQKFTGEGEFLISIGKSGAGRGQFNRPSDVAVDNHGDIYVADLGNDRVQMFDSSGEYLEQFIGDATLSKLAKQHMMVSLQAMRLREKADLERTKRFRHPRSIAVDDEFRLYVVDHRSHRIQVYQKDAIPLKPDQIAPPVKTPNMVTA
jgi:sugar lactone lactonase YvrE